ncbi:MAG TPA: ABC transporter permease [Terracidiphilus sp.]|nr:ABC transporter permease [Terracidiphilus sp.]
MQSLLRNLRFGARMMAKSPGFTLAAILILVLGIGANAAIFTVTNAVLLRPFPYPDPQQLVHLVARDKTKTHAGTLLRYELVRDQNHVFQSVAAWASDNLNLTGAGEPMQAAVARVSPSFFTVFGVRPELGRVFAEDEGRPQGGLVILLSDALWRSRFHGDPNVVGKTVMLDSKAHTIVGVLPADAQFPFMEPADVWIPRYFEYSLMSPQRLRMGVGYLDMAARLRPDVTMAQADEDLAVLNRRYIEQNPAAPDADAAVEWRVEYLRNLVVGNVRAKLWVLSGAVGLVLLIACANVASLMLSRALSRRKEMAVRAALGASRGEIIGQLLTESLMLSLIAGTLGIALSWFAVPALTSWSAAQLPQAMPIGVDASVLLFTLAASLFAGIAFGVAPALELARVEPNAMLRDEGRGASAGRARVRMQSALVVSQVALSLLLLIGGGLLLRSFVRLLGVDPGFDARNVLTMNISLSTVKYSKPEQQVAFFNEVLQRVGELPGVHGAAISAAVPLSFMRITPMLPEGQAEVPLGQRPFIDIEAVSPRWFQTLRVPLRSGREFTEAEDAHAPRVAIVNERFARQFWPNESAVGKHIVVGRGPAQTEVVGVTADVKNQGLEQDPQAQIYVPYAQLPWGEMNLLARTAMRPEAAISAVKAQIAAVDGDQPVTGIKTVEELMRSARAQPRFTMLLVGAFSMTALALAAIGIYGLLSFTIAQREQEFGIRLALGAGRADILRLVLRQGVVLTASGITAGLIAALLLTRLAVSLLYGVSARDATTFVLAPILFVAIALAASYLAARRTMRVNPIEAMK